MKLTEKLLNLSARLTLAKEKADVLTLAHELNDLSLDAITAEQTAQCGYSQNRHLIFTEKEIMKMPKTFRKTFRDHGRTVHYRKRTDGRYNCSYEIRYAKRPYDKHPITASGTTLEEAKARFIEKINSIDPTIDIKKENLPTTFHDFSMYYFENYRIKAVKKQTFDNDMYRYRNHLKDYFASTPIKQIDSDMIQNFVDPYIEEDHIKTAKELVSLLSGIFKYAVEKKLIDRNPCKLVLIESYESEHGIPLTLEEEHHLIDSLKDNRKYLVPLAVVLYSGLRPCEYKTATIDGDFIKAENRKRHSKKVSYKYIPICNRLKEILGDTTELCFPHKSYMREKLIAACPGHKLYDLRTTFDTRCETYHIAEIARKSWMGHGLEKLRKAYGQLPDEWFIEEMKRIECWR